MVRAAHHTFGLDTVITRCSNNYGPYQFPEKLIPLFITNVMADIPVPVYGDGRQVRDWIHVLDHCRGIDAALRRGRAGEVYNFGGKSERYNIDVTRAILKLCGKPESLIRYVTDRLGHDRRYAINCAKAEAELGWRPTVAFEEGLAATVAWYQTHTDWVDRVRSGAYRAARDKPLNARRVEVLESEGYPPMRALVTGVSGFVGGHLAEHLVAEGDLVVGIFGLGALAGGAGAPGEERADRAVRPGRAGRGRAGRAGAPQAARGDLSPGRAVESAGEPRPTRVAPGPSTSAGA